MPVTSERDLAMAVLRIASGAPNGIATFDQCYAEIPNLIILTTEDLTPSATRNGEPMWKQRVRNIQSHHVSDENFISLGYLEHVVGTGYKILPAGRALL